MNRSFSIRALLSLVRFDNALFGSLTIFLAGILSSDISGSILEYVIAFISVLFLGMGSFAVNDYFDHEIDRANTGLIDQLYREPLREKQLCMQV
jgi:4-hydroxybenzoate polyprenyltransferase